MEKKLIGKVTEAERDEIRMLFERKNALTELFKTVDVSKDELYDKIVVDMGKTASKFQTWWDEKSLTYQWESLSNHRWEIDFNTCQIYLAEED